MDFAWVVTTGLAIKYDVQAPLDTVEAVQNLCCMLRRECQTMEELGILELEAKATGDSHGFYVEFHLFFISHAPCPCF